MGDTGTFVKKWKQAEPIRLPAMQPMVPAQPVQVPELVPMRRRTG